MQMRLLGRGWSRLLSPGSPFLDSQDRFVSFAGHRAPQVTLSGLSRGVAAPYRHHHHREDNTCTTWRVIQVIQARTVAIFAPALSRVMSGAALLPTHTQPTPTHPHAITRTPCCATTHLQPHSGWSEDGRRKGGRMHQISAWSQSHTVSCPPPTHTHPPPHTPTPS